MKQLSYLFILLAVVMMSCKSSEESANTHDSADHSEMSNGVEKEASSTEDAASDFEAQTTERKRMTGDELVGQWVWVQTSCCGRMTRDIFPEEGDEKKVISFDEKGNAMYYSGDEDKKLQSYTYTLDKLGNQTTVRMGDLQPAIFYVEGDELILSWGYMDLQIEYYQRQK